MVEGAARDLMTTLAAGILIHEAFAADLARLAGFARSTGDRIMAETFVFDAREHRAASIQLRARLGALVDRYGALHLDR